MTFAQAAWLISLLILPLLALLYVAGEVRARKRLSQFASKRLLPALVPAGSRLWRHIRFGLALAAVALVITALARPQYGETVRSIKATGADVIFAIDVSRSMLASDLPPDRLTRAKLAVQDLLEVLEGNRVGLVAFAGTAFLQCPLTLDYDAFRNSLLALEPGVIPTQGTNLAAAIAEAQEALTNEGEGKKYLVLMTDGEDLEAAGLKQAREVEGITIITVGVGTQEGAPVPDVKDESPLARGKDTRRQTVISHLDPQTLEAIAEARSGFYLQLDRDGLNAIQNVVSEGGTGKTEEELSIPHERYQWPLAAALILLFLQPLVGLKRSATLPLLFIMSLSLMPQTSDANEVATGDIRVVYNEGVEAYQREDLEAAYERFQTVVDQSKDQSLKSKAAYNAATVLLKPIDPKSISPDGIDAAIETAIQGKQLLETALNARPDWQEAKDNFRHAVELIKELEALKQSQNPSPQQDPNQDQQSEENQNSDQDEASSQDPQGQNEGSQSEPQENQQSQSGEQSETHEQQGNENQGQQQDGTDQEGQQQQSSDGQTGDQGDPQATSPSSDTEDGEQQTGPTEGEDSSESPESMNEGRASQSSEESGESPIDGAPGQDVSATAQAQTQVLELTREEAERLLRSLQREEKVLPAGRLVQPLERGEGRDW